MYIEALSLFIVYLLGGIPLGYIYALIVLKNYQKSIKNASFDSVSIFSLTHSLHHGIMVLSLDILKGYFIIRYSNIFFTQLPPAEIIVFVLTLGHCFPLWHKFLRGGKGLTVACGSLIYFNPLSIIFWIGIWLFLFNKVSSFELRNLFAIIGTIFVLVINDFFAKSNFQMYTVGLIPLSILLIVTHSDILKKYINTIR